MIKSWSNQDRSNHSLNSICLSRLGRRRAKQSSQGFADNRVAQVAVLAGIRRALSNFFLIPLLYLCVLLCPYQLEAESRVINAGGSSFIYPLMTKWTSEYQKRTGVLLNYQSLGSGAGVQQMLGGTFDFGCTDAPMNAEQLAKADSKNGEVLHVPLIMGAVVPVYTIAGLKQSLRFSGPVLAEIFLGRIRNWNDPALTALNPEAQLPDLPIAVVRRSDGSGSTYLFTEFLSKTSPDWQGAVGIGMTVDWPRGIGQRGNEGVAGQVARTNGAIGYVELIYALQSKLSYGAVQNQAGKFVDASLASVTAAAEGALSRVPDDLRYSLTNAPGADSYPIAGTTWAVVYSNAAKDNNGKIASFLRWATQEGQSIATQLNYARLPSGIVERLMRKLDEIAPEKKV
ncbi:MAG: phosphate ABC transporter substrate-binding protein PstS [Proteobacteria bacterium]|nr:phosphate ABC transporter substrate-binding protein PstS [Pseudomonadota bacterium]